jgi:hypothetical protein
MRSRLRLAIRGHHRLALPFGWRRPVTGTEIGSILGIEAETEFIFLFVLILWRRRGRKRSRCTRRGARFSR